MDETQVEADQYDQNGRDKRMRSICMSSSYQRARLALHSREVEKNLHVVSVGWTKVRIIETACCRPVEVVKEDRIDYLLDRDAANICRAQGSETDRSDLRRQALVDIHAVRVSQRHC